MCGIAGGHWRNSEEKLTDRLDRAAYELRLRGPDDSGREVNCSAAGVTAFVHARLSIIDLSAGGHQPKLSPDGRHSIIFNGEIYNYRELRSALVGLGHQIGTNSDTEVLLAAWREWGIECLRHLNGMFAFAVHDRKLGKLTLVRDGFGIKPLFYGMNKDRVVFASTISALRALAAQRVEPNLQRCYDYLVHADYDSNAESFIAGFYQLEPGRLIEIDLESLKSSGPIAWWTPPTSLETPKTFEEAALMVREQFLENVRLHLRSDVSLGAALSGGIDSSAVVCAIRHLEPSASIKTFSFIADDQSISEEHWLDMVNAEAGCVSHKIRATARDLWRDLDDMIQAQDEPFGSTSLYAQYRVFQLARDNGVTVTLEGQGADELLAGYTGYAGHRLLSKLETGEILGSMRFLADWAKWPGRSIGQGVMEFGRVTLSDSVYGEARRYFGRNFQPDWLNVGMLEEAGVHFIETRPLRSRRSKGRRVIEQLSHSLQGRGLPALLRHGDRNSMRFSIESRVPFLTLDFAELLLSLPEDFLISERGETKSVFRHAMRGIVPDAILDRKDKIGFATPEQRWLLELAPKFRDWLKESAPEVPFIKSDELINAFDAIVAGKHRFTWQMWRWINYIRWYRWQQFSA
ncbi:MAG: asparagine synthase (glutamine-hydrolyzing) [Sphingomonadales bacterium]|jgi:asparagine synthase (glutamine-hydrolysing)|nr:asparagine synthase (glutamine-hydrolyzing) [Sphingomonadales bacterium]MBK9004869.1 asparagine synthase (glutamine-hydrolyzing) [Sphingomonadales bacterium]MBK9267401.1 asparagine synthase (glutamine-hydrolyzing) [Sphingomonadales bacterium]